VKVYIPPYDDSGDKQKAEIEIHPYDTWSLDYTLAKIILPCLKQLKETKHGAPNTEDEDVPEWLRSTAAPPKENAWDIDANWFKRWDWIMDEMIFAFEFLNEDSDDRYDEQKNDRCNNGLKLFGKYYRGLWD
jgi:hypothetical protein